MNRWNDIIPGIREAISGVTQGILQHSQKTEANKEFEDTRKQIRDSYQQLLAQNNAVVNPEGDKQKGNSSLAPVNENQIRMDLYDKLLSSQTKLAQNPYGKPYAEGENQYYNMLFPKQEYEYKTIKSGDGSEQIVKHDKNSPNSGWKQDYNSGSKPIKDTEDPKNWETNTDENGNPYWGVRVKDENGNWTFKKVADYTTEDKKNYNDANAEEQKKLTPHIGSHRGIKIKEDKSVSGYDKDLTKDIEDYGKLKRMDWNDMSDKQKEQYKTLNDRIKQNTNKDADEITNDVMGKAFKSPKEKADYINKQKQEKSKWNNLPEFAKQSDDNTLKYFSNYMEQLNEAFQRNDGSYDGYKKSFLKDLEQYKNYLTKEDYNYLFENYK